MKLKFGEKIQIARAAKASPQMIGDILRGRRRPSPDLARRLEKATGISRMAWLWPREFKNPFLLKNK